MGNGAVCADFYELVSPRWETEICDRVAALAAEGVRIYLRADSQARAHRIQELLWTFRDDSFVPHGLWQGEQGCDEPVAVGWLDGNPNGARVLVLCCSGVPPELAAQTRVFSRLVDFVPKRDAGETQAARERYRTLSQAGIPVEYHAAQG